MAESTEAALGKGESDVAQADRWEPSFYIEGKGNLALCTIRFVRYVDATDSTGGSVESHLPACTASPPSLHH